MPVAEKAIFSCLLIIQMQPILFSIKIVEAIANWLENSQMQTVWSSYANCYFCCAKKCRDFHENTDGLFGQYLPKPAGRRHYAAQSKAGRVALAGR
jgi:hypothetical protein